jgi:hypothetical protein
VLTVNGRRLRASAAAALTCCALLLSGCGSSTLSNTQLRRKAGSICMTAQRSTASITAPTDPADGERFLRRGIAALAPQVAALQKLKPSREEANDYATALRTSERELALLRTTIKGLAAGDDPVVTIKALQGELGPAEDAAGQAWRDVDVPACATVMG